MLSALFIRIPQFVLGGHRAAYRPISINYYKGWTPSDYEAAYWDANETPFTWDDVVVPRRSPRLAAKERKNYKL
jgi:hypothetical protein